MKLPAASGRGFKRLKKMRMATTPNWKLGYDCGGLALKPHPLLNVHLFLFELYDPRGNKYQ